jgi:transcriptional regulator with XRE-family HTH domain
MAELDATVGERVRQIREARGEKQPEFATALNAAAVRLGITARYDGTTVSKLETGMRRATLEDIELIAAIDPGDRGRDWLGWGGVPRADPSRFRRAGRPRRDERKRG